MSGITFSLSRALHLVRYGKAKVRNTEWPEGLYMYLSDLGILVIYTPNLNKSYPLEGLDNEELLGNWEEVK